jgi:hypothetical protein
MRSPLTYRWIPGVLLLCLTVPAQAQDRAQRSGSVIQGIVRSGADDRPLAGALVTLVPLSVGRETAPTNNAIDSLPDALASRTLSDGRYSFTRLAPGDYRLTVTRAEYLPATFEVELGSRTNLNLSAVLEVEPIELEPLPQDTTAIVTGRVTDATSGAPVANVEVTLEGTVIRTLTDAEGRYWLVNVPPGPQTVRTRRIGYASNRIPISVPLTGTITQDIPIAASALMVEGITVTGDAVSRAAGEIATATVIESEAIRTQTATSLRGVLELVPGIEAQPAGLDDIQQVALRVAPTSGFSASGLSASGVGTTAAAAAASGTLIVLDGVPVSNNANLQVAGRDNGILFTTSAGAGVDLRSIPARTIERVEVIRGVPSARYGDLTQGAIIVETRAGPVDPEVAVLFDRRTIEASIVGGLMFGGPDHAATATADLSRTRSQPGLTDDASYRFAGQLSHRIGLGRGPAASTLGSRLLLDTRIDGFQLIDDRPTTAGDEGRSFYSRDRGLRISERARLALSRQVDVTFTGSLTLLQQRNSGATPLSRGPMPITDRLTEGRSEGNYAVGLYVAEATMDGDQRLWFGRLEAEGHPRWLGGDHLLKAGIEFRREWNVGPGYQFDIKNPPQVTFNGVNGFARPRRYDDVAPLVTSALYLDDRVIAPMGARGLLTFQAGLRLDVLHDGTTWFSSVRDAELGPRLNLELSPWRWLRLRGGWGLVTKTPWLAQLYPAPQYYDVTNVNWFANDPAERLAVITTFVEDPTNPDLGFAVAEKEEAGIEIGPGQWAVSLVAFHDRVRNAVAELGVPGFLLRDQYELTDSTRGTGVPPDILEPPAYSDTVPILVPTPDNVMSVDSRGIELQAVLPEIPRLRIRLHVTGQWIETRQTVDALYFGQAYRFSEFALTPALERTPYWGPITELGRRALFTYRVIHHQPSLGLVLTGIIQHNVFDHVEDLGALDTLSFLGYLTRAGELVEVPASERGDPQYADLHVPRPGTLNEVRHTPCSWMLSVQVSKTFPLGGRLSFWAFNVLDRQGRLEGAWRLYAAMRFGIELSMPVRGLVPWLD